MIRVKFYDGGVVEYILGVRVREENGILNIENDDEVIAQLASAEVQEFAEDVVPANLPIGVVA